MTLLFNILSWVFVIISFIALILIYFWVFSGFNKKTRFTPIPNFILKRLPDILKVKENSIIYHLGCGDGRVLFYLGDENSKAEYIGIEDNKFSLFLFNFQNWLNRIQKKNQIKVIDDNFFKQDLSKATHLITYLNPDVMDDLLPKLEGELVSGTRLFSLNFQFTTKKPITEIDINKKSYQPKQKIYIYEF